MWGIFTCFHGGNGRIVYISVEFGQKRVTETEIFNIVVTDIGNHHTHPQTHTQTCKLLVADFVTPTSFLYFFILLYARKALAFS